MPTSAAWSSPVSFIRIVRNVIAALFVDRTRVDEVFMQVVNIF